jgi:hypothetical protein
MDAKKLIGPGWTCEVVKELRKAYRAADRGCGHVHVSYEDARACGDVMAKRLGLTWSDIQVWEIPAK